MNEPLQEEVLQAAREVLERRGAPDYAGRTAYRDGRVHITEERGRITVFMRRGAMPVTVLEAEGECVRFPQAAVYVGRVRNLTEVQPDASWVAHLLELAALPPEMGP